MEEKNISGDNTSSLPAHRRLHFAWHLRFANAPHCTTISRDHFQSKIYILRRWDSALLYIVLCTVMRKYLLRLNSSIVRLGRSPSLFIYFLLLFFLFLRARNRIDLLEKVDSMSSFEIVSNSFLDKFYQHFLLLGAVVLVESEKNEEIIDSKIIFRSKDYIYRFEALIRYRMICEIYKFFR